MGIDDYTKIKHWDLITKCILVISILVILFSFFAPYIFTTSLFFELFDFTHTGQIGDTIGGIINPFIALAGVLLTFLAFYMQIKANQIQISQFTASLNIDKENRIQKEERDYYHKLSLLKADLETIESDINEKAESVKYYYEKEKMSPFHNNILIKLPTKKYSRILEIDRLSIFNGFSLIFSKTDNWIKDFSILYDILDFLPELYKHIYDKYDDYSKKLYNKKVAIGEDLGELISELSGVINKYFKDKGKENYLSFPVSELFDKTVKKYHKILDESYDIGDVKEESQLEKINIQVLKHLLTELMIIRNSNTHYDNCVDDIIIRVSDIRKQLAFIKQMSAGYVKNIQTQYEDLVIDKDGELCYKSQIIEIRKKLDLGLKKIELD